MPKEFTLTELEKAFETVTQTPLDKRNFRKKIAKLKLVEKTGRMQQGIQGRPAALWKFKSRKVQFIEIL